MENASKALIIAGAILISILLIAVSMYIYNASQDTISQAGNSMSQQAKSAYNSEMESYLGSNISSTQVKALIQAVINTNNAYAGEPGKAITLKIGSNTYGPADDTARDNNDDSSVNTWATQMSEQKSKISSNKKYDANATYTAGIITEIDVTVN